MPIEDLRERFGRFRILVIGRANAGKTTILKKICDSTEDPEIYNGWGRKVWFPFQSGSHQGLMVGDQVDRAQIQGSAGVSASRHYKSKFQVQLMCFKRGMHDIENEMVFRSNSGFVFHDSQGFEAGGVKEFDRMKDFVAERAKTTFLKRRIHAIW